jgi:hypothetical protein
VEAARRWLATPAAYRAAIEVLGTSNG